MQLSRIYSFNNLSYSPILFQELEEHPLVSAKDLFMAPATEGQLMSQNPNSDKRVLIGLNFSRKTDKKCRC